MHIYGDSDMELENFKWEIKKYLWNVVGIDGELISNFSSTCKGRKPNREDHKQTKPCHRPKKKLSLTKMIIHNILPRNFFPLKARNFLTPFKDDFLFLPWIRGI